MVEPMRNVKCDGCGGVPAFNKRLPCHRIYCGACIDDMEAAAREGSQPTITCQSLSCGAVHHIPEGAGSLPSDESVARMVENLGRLELSDLCSSADCGKEVYKFDCKHCHKSFCHDCFIQHFKDCISEKISFYESAIPHFCDLEQQLLQNKASIQSARTEMYGKIRSCISRLEKILNDSIIFKVHILRAFLIFVTRKSFGHYYIKMHCTLYSAWLIEIFKIYLYTSH